MINIKRLAEHITLGILDIEEFSKESNLSNKRETERQGTGILLKKLYNGNAPKLSYTSENKPFFSDSSDHLSISHSHGKLAILINRNESCGVDVELLREKILNIRHKFLNPDEMGFAGTNIKILTAIWAAKEAIYKAYGKKQLDFMSHMKIDRFSEDQNEFFGYLHKNEIKKKYLLRSEGLEGYTLVYTYGEV